MKFTKKKVFVTALAVSLIAILSFGTLAWFTASQDATNYFHVTANEGGNADFALDLYETEVNPETGKFGDGEDADTTVDEVERNDYNNILPGAELDKNPTVRNTGSYDQFVRVTVTFDDVSKLPAGYEPSSMLKTVDSTVWSYNAETDKKVSGNTVSYTYYLIEKLDAKVVGDEETTYDEATLFTSVEIPTALDVATFNSDTDMTISVHAEAVQADNIGDGTCRGAFAVIDAE